MKMDFNRKYTTIALYSLLVIAAGACIIMAVVKIRAVGALVGKVLSILQPFIWGFAIAYILNPLMNAMERLLTKVSKGAMGARAKRRLSVLLAYLISLAVLVVFFRIVIPQIGLSLAALANQIPEWLEKLRDLVGFLVPLYQKEGKSQLIIGVGCTGGKHRSVTFAEALYQFLAERGYNVRVVHRDISK